MKGNKFGGFFICFFALAVIFAIPAVHTWSTVSMEADNSDETEPDIIGNKGNDSKTEDELIADKYFFEKQTLSARAGEKIQLQLSILDQAGNPEPAADTVITIYDTNKCFTDKTSRTDSNGTAVLTFDKPGIYYAGANPKENIKEPDLCRIHVKKASVSFVKKSQTLKLQTGTEKGGSKNLSVMVNGKRIRASELTWRVGNKKIASLKNGTMTAKKEGKTTVYATIYDTTAKCSITVLDKRKLIVLDPGHQEHQNTAKEPLAPGSNELKMKVTSGTAGTYSGSEYQLNLTVSKKLKKVLQKKNYRVLMTRTTNQVNISNKERAEIANEANADAFIRIHANSSTSSSASGILTICPTKSSPYCQSIYKKSRRLSDSILEHMQQKTGASQGRIWETDTMTGINWSRVPVTIVELGYQSNPTEDRLLATDAYQNKLVLGMAAGLDEYFHISP